MSFKFPRFQLLALCRRHFLVCVCGVFACIQGGDALAAPGQLDPTFGANGVTKTSFAGFSTIPWALAALPSGKTLLVASCESAAGNRFCAARFSADGTPDASFAINGQYLAPAILGFDSTRALALYEDGRFLIGGVCSESISAGAYRANLCVMRFLPTGNVDPTFGSNGVVVTAGSRLFELSNLLITSDGSILAVGRCNDFFSSQFCAAKVGDNGAIDTTYGLGGIAVVPPSSQLGTIAGASDAVLLDGGRVLMIGICSMVPSAFRSGCAVRVSATGSLDVAYGMEGWVRFWFGGAIASAARVTPQSAETTILGSCNEGSGNSLCSARLSADGTLDPTFGVSGVVRQANGLVEWASDAYRQQDDRWVVAAKCRRLSDASTCVARVGRDGLLDVTFGESGHVFPWTEPNNDSRGAIAVDAIGKILVTGSCITTGGAIVACLARLEGGPYPTKDCALNADGNLVTNPATDALLLSRYLLGLRGDALTNGAIGANPIRTGQILETYLASLDLDADGDGQSLAMTDGLLILRAMLGLSGDSLTAGAVNTAHPSARNAQQVLSWIESTHGAACLP